MDRSCFGKIILISFLVMNSLSAHARCPLADKYRSEGREVESAIALNLCALMYNDDESQLKMAEGYQNGTNGLQKNEKQALYMYQLAAEAGNAEAQVRLAEMLQTFDASSERRQELKKYQGKLGKTTDEEGVFEGEIYHPYTLLLLASERVENKWYYPSKNRAAPARASQLLKNYKITPEKKQAALKDASRWKTRKLLEIAKEVLAPSEYPDFEKRLKNNSSRSQAMKELQTRVNAYIEKRKKERPDSL